MTVKPLGRTTKDATTRITYEARRLTTSLTDVKVTVWDDKRVKVVDAAVCSELQDGVYYYDYIALEEGNYIFSVDSASQPARLTGSFYIPVKATKPSKQTHLERAREPYNVNNVRTKRNVERRDQLEGWDNWTGRSMTQ